MKQILKNLRIQTGFTQCQVAKAVGVLQSSVSQWENGDTFPHPSKIPQLAKLFNVPTDDIIAACEDARMQKQNSA